MGFFKKPRPRAGNIIMEHDTATMIYENTRVQLERVHKNYNDNMYVRTSLDLLNGSVAGRMTAIKEVLQSKPVIKYNLNLYTKHARHHAKAVNHYLKALHEVKVNPSKKQMKKLAKARENLPNPVMNSLAKARLAQGRFGGPNELDSRKTRLKLVEEFENSFPDYFNNQDAYDINRSITIPRLALDICEFARDTYANESYFKKGNIEQRQQKIISKLPARQFLQEQQVANKQNQGLERKPSVEKPQRNVPVAKVSPLTQDPREIQERRNQQRQINYQMRGNPAMQPNTPVADVTPGLGYTGLDANANVVPPAPQRQPQPTNYEVLPRNPPMYEQLPPDQKRELNYTQLPPEDGFQQQAAQRTLPPLPQQPLVSNASPALSKGIKQATPFVPNQQPTQAQPIRQDRKLRGRPPNSRQAIYSHSTNHAVNQNHQDRGENVDVVQTRKMGGMHGK